MWWTTHRVVPFLSRSNPGHVYLHFIGQMSHSVVLAFTCVVTYKATWVQKIISWRVPNRYLPPSVKTSPATYMTRPSASHLHYRITLLWPLLTGIQVDTETRIFYLSWAFRIEKLLSVEHEVRVCVSVWIWLSCI